ncbi:MAG: metalloregulator ArsR/SmtB family transcription factor [Syntrophomonadaceae bacterium]|nr:metalloregulator ArsR/SmtB family transcription factor [Syntrophomonadaceae bacterium]MDD3022558.1 metalloregulator ArsR/SmtB family transcription factor [Syntrophomonadaceae bacterium]
MFETIFKALGEPTRLKIIKLLSIKELCVCDLEEIMQISQPRISQHLKVLKYAGLVNERKEGQRSICSLNKVLLNNTMDEFQEYIDKPLEEIPELAGEHSRIPCIDGEACKRKLGTNCKIE